jgi:hypothetical protein
MTVNENFNGPFVEDADERRAYVSKEDAITLAKWYNLNPGYSFKHVLVYCSISAITASILAELTIR